MLRICISIFAILFFCLPSWATNLGTGMINIPANVGIGTMTPLGTLEVNGSLYYTNGNQQNGYVLSSDANGLADWVSASSLGNASAIDNLIDGDTTDSSSVALGMDARAYGSESVALGIKALESASASSSHLIAIGHKAMQSSTNATNNIAIGANGLVAMTDNGTGNIAIGYLSLDENIFGNYNIAAGHVSLTANTNGDNNTAVGYGALGNNSIGNSNSAFGYATLGVTNGDYNSAFGEGILAQLKSGTGNVGVGYQSLYYTSNGDNNIGIGYKAGSDIGIGNGSVGIGASSLFNNVNGHNNVAVGLSAGGGNATTNGYAQNVFIGAASGLGVNNGNGNIALGYYAADNLDQGDRNLAIGYNIDIPSATYSDQMNIGDLIYGDLANKRIGIDLNNQPFTTLDQALNVNGAIALREMASSPVNGANMGVFYVKSSDSLIYFNDDAGNGYTLTAAGSTGELQYRNGNLYDASPDLFWQISNGYLGIGTNGPKNRAHIHNSSGAEVGLQMTSVATGSRFSNGLHLAYDSNGDFQVNNKRASSYLQFQNNGTLAMFIDANGNVGINTTLTSPGYNLEVIGTAAKTGGGTWSVASDRRLKEIDAIYSKGLEAIQGLEPVKFHYKKTNARKLPGDQQEYGFIAQEVQAIFPEAVHQGGDSYLDFNMHTINIAMLNAIQNLKFGFQSEKDRSEVEIEDLQANLDLTLSYICAEDPSAVLCINTVIEDY